MSLEKKLGSMALAAWLTLTGPVGPVVAEGIVPKNPLTPPDPVAGKGEMASQKEIDLLKQKEIEIINQRFAEFLAGDGAYSDEKLKEIFYQSAVGSSMDLGYLETYGSECLVQSPLLYSKNRGGSEFFALGVKNKSGDRKITMATWPLGKFFEISSKVYIGKSLGSSSTSNKFYSEEEVGSFFSENYERMYRLQFLYEDVGKNSPLFQGQKLKALYDSTYLPSIPYNREFLADINVPLDRKDIGETGNMMLDSLPSGQLLEIKTYEEFLDVIETGKSLPVVFGINYKEK